MNDVATRPLKKNQIRVTSKEVYNFLKEKQEAGFNPTFRDAAFHFMPPKTRWFESGADWSLAFWLERLCRIAQKRGNHVVGIFTFPKPGKC